MKNILAENMQRFGTKNLTEQTVQTESALQQTIELHRNIINAALRDIQSGPGPDDLKETARIILEAYVMYLGKTQTTAREYPEVEEQDVLDENKVDILETIKSELTY